jgi:hypothetical protein
MGGHVSTRRGPWAHLADYLSDSMEESPVHRHGQPDQAKKLGLPLSACGIPWSIGFNPELTTSGCQAILRYGEEVFYAST